MMTTRYVECAIDTLELEWDLLESKFVSLQMPLSMADADAQSRNSTENIESQHVPYIYEHLSWNVNEFSKQIF